MISTVSTTVSTVVSTVASPQVLVSLGLSAVLTLIACLVVKELATASQGPRLQMLGRGLSVPILPLVFVLCFIFIMKVIEILS